MTHDTFTEKISLWLDNELDAVETAKLQAHLTDCSTCQHSYQAMQQIDHFFRKEAKVMAAPAVDFVERFETRLARHCAQSEGHLWWGLGTLLLGVVCLLIITGLMVSIFVSAGMNMIGVSLLYDWLANFIESANLIGVWLSSAGVFWKACLITMRQPPFWVCAVAAIGLAWLWWQLLKSVYQRSGVTLGLFI